MTQVLSLVALWICGAFFGAGTTVVIMWRRKAPVNHPECECGHPFCYHHQHPQAAKTNQQVCSVLACGCINYTPKAVVSDREFLSVARVQI